MHKMPYKLECDAILEGVKMASGLTRNIIMKTDCKEVVEAIKNDYQESSNVAASYYQRY